LPSRLPVRLRFSFFPYNATGQIVLKLNCEAREHTTFSFACLSGRPPIVRRVFVGHPPESNGPGSPDVEKFPTNISRSLTSTLPPMALKRFGCVGVRWLSLKKNGHVGHAFLEPSSFCFHRGRPFFLQFFMACSTFSESALLPS